MPPARPAQILIVDDSSVVRSLLTLVVNADPNLEVVGTANDGASALEAIARLHPDLVLLDVEMPIMDGLSTLKQIHLRDRKLPVIMCSALTQRGAKVTIEALAIGAADYIGKPSGQISREAATLALSKELIPKILALTGRQPAAPLSFRPATLSAAFSAGPARAGVPSSVVPPAAAATGPVSTGPAFTRPGVIAPDPRLSGPPSPPPSLARSYPAASSKPEAIALPPTARPRILLIGVSTGGPAALEVVLPALPASFPLPVLVVQHMPEIFTKLLAERLDSRCALRVREAVSGEPVRAGQILIAKGNWHLEIRPSLANDADGQPVLITRLTQNPPESHCRPAVDVLFRTAVAIYGAATLGVILTGMGSDGLIGSRLIRGHGGTILAQDEATSAVWGMPAAVANAGLAHRVLPLEAIAPAIVRLIEASQRKSSSSLGDPVADLAESALLSRRGAR